MDELERQRELLLQTMDEFNRAGLNSARTMDELDKATSKSAKSLDKFEEFTNTYGRKITQLGTDFDKNKGKMSAFSGITDLAGDALGELGFAGRMAGKALSAIAGITFEEVDRTMENFQKIGSVGAVGAEGMTEFRLGAHAARLTMDQFANIIAKNSNALALATGNTLDGAQALSQVTKAAGDTGLRRQLLNLGVGIEEQTDFFADYFAQVRRLGLQQNRDYRSQTNAVGNYVKQLILLSRLTGESIDSAKAQMEAQNRSARFQGAMQELAANTSVEYANRIAVEVGALGNKLGPAGTQMLMDIFSGPNTQAAKDFLITFGAEGQAAIDRVKSGAADLGELSEMIVRSGMAQRERFGGPGQLGLLAETGAIDATVEALLSVPRATELTREALQKQVDAINAGAGGADKLTENLNKAAEASQDAAVNLESTRDIFLNIGSTVLPAFSGAIEGATDMLKGLVHGVGGGLQIDGANADGGPVKAGGTYLVGEEGPELIVPSQNGTVISNDDIQGRLDTVRQALADVPSFVEGFKSAFLPGIGEVAEYAAGNMSTMMIKTLDGQIEEYARYNVPTNDMTVEAYRAGGQTFAQGSYQFGDYQAETGFAQVGGPRTMYDSIMAGVNPADAGTAQSERSITESQTTRINDNRELVQLMQTLNENMQQVVSNTRTGADTSKKLLRASTG